MKTRFPVLSIVPAFLLALGFAASSFGCAAELDFNDPHGHAYHHRHYHDEEVYQHEDGHWYARRHDNWVAVEVTE